MQAVFLKSKLSPIFQNDQDRKQRTKLVMETVEKLFTDRVQPLDDDVKLVDLWRIENVWEALEEYVTRIRKSS